MNANSKRIILENLKVVDTVIEILDARAPISTRNFDVRNLIVGKNRIIAINKADLVNKEDIEKVEEYFKKELKYSICISAKEGSSIKRLFYMLEAIYESKKRKFALKKIKALPLKVMIMGIPNVGKSQLINMLTGRKIVKVENRPGSTKGQQWIKIIPNVELLDTPGVLWSSNKEDVIKKLQILGNLKIRDLEIIANDIIDIISLEKLNEYYKLALEDKNNTLIKLQEKLNQKDINNICKLIIDDFREGKLGKYLIDDLNKVNK